MTRSKKAGLNGAKKNSARSTGATHGTMFSGWPSLGGDGWRHPHSQAHGKKWNKFGFTLQIYEVDHIDHNFTTKYDNGNFVRMGIEQDEFGRIVAFHLLKQHPGEMYFPVMGYARVRVPAKSSFIICPRSSRPNGCRSMVHRFNGMDAPSERVPESRNHGGKGWRVQGRLVRARKRREFQGR
jgi:hypothetical protein